MSENYIASFEVSAGASGGLGRKVHDVYKRDIVFFSEEGRAVSDALIIFRKVVLREGYLTSPRDDCVRGKLVELRTERGKHSLFREGIEEVITQTEI